MRVLLIEDDSATAQSIELMLKSESFNVYTTDLGEEGVDLGKLYDYDIILLDLNLPDIGGLEIITRLKIADPAARIVVLSMHDDQIHVTRALQAGAAGYVSKNIPPEELLEAIGRVAGGRTYIEREIAEELVFSCIRTPPHPLDELSSRDLEILRLLAQGRSLAQIADALGIGYKTAANNCSQIKAKLRAPTTADLIRIAIRHGLADRDARRP